jgi:hypothetical protein
MEIPSLTAAVRAELLSLPDVTEAPHRFGGIVFHLGRRELGHLHGERVADLPFAPHIRDELVASGRIAALHARADSDWVSTTVEGPEDVARIVELFRISYEYAAAQPADDAIPPDDAVAAHDAVQPHAGWLAVLTSPLHAFRRGRGRR